MYRFKLANLPEALTKNYKTYVRYKNQAFDIPIETQVAELEKKGFLVIVLEVLSTRLRGKLDLHNKPYQPTEWIFIHDKKSRK